MELGEPSPFFATLLEGGLPQRSFEEVNFNTQASPIHQARSADAVGLALASLMELPAGSDLQNQVRRASFNFRHRSGGRTVVAPWVPSRFSDCRLVFKLDFLDTR